MECILSSIISGVVSVVTQCNHVCVVSLWVAEITVHLQVDISRGNMFLNF